MNFSTIKGYIFVIFSSGMMLMGAFITILQGGLLSDFTVFGKPAQKVNTGVLMLFSAVGGIIIYLCMHLLFAGITSARKGREEARRRVGTRLADLGKDDRG